MYQKVKSLERALKIMELLREKSILNEYVSPREAAAAAGISAVSAYNILNTLEECGYVRRSGRGRYEEGGQGTFPLLGAGLMPRLREAARPLLTEAAAAGRESYLLVTLNNGKRAELLRIGRIKNSRQATAEANAEPYSMRTVRVILAWYQPAQLEFFILRNGLPSVGDWPETGGTLAGLRRELRAVREQGGCCEVHVKRGLTATAVPVLSPGDEVVASLGCYSPIKDTDALRQKGIFRLLQELAARLRDGL